MAVIRDRDRAARLLIRITVLRIVLIPAVMALVLVGDRVDFAYVTAACLFVIAAGTDFIDGYLARRWEATTALGSFLDTTADKLLVTGAIVALVEVGRASAWIAVVIIGRELLILGLRGMVALDGTVMPPSIWGKWKATVQFVAITLAIVRFSDPLGPLYLDEWVMIGAAIITAMSGFEYLGRYSGALTSERRGGRP
jgi:CDP-diacylglycerol---glycerol-3-phosphate 3-phosphatidyltransferase